LKVAINLPTTHYQLPVEGFRGADDFLEDGGAVSFVWFVELLCFFFMLAALRFSCVRKINDG
jgi:hypothetical protein